MFGLRECRSPDIELDEQDSSPGAQNDMTHGAAPISKSTCTLRTPRGLKARATLQEDPHISTRARPCGGAWGASAPPNVRVARWRQKRCVRHVRVRDGESMINKDIELDGQDSSPGAQNDMTLGAAPISKSTCTLRTPRGLKARATWQEDGPLLRPSALGRLPNKVPIRGQAGE